MIKKIDLERAASRIYPHVRHTPLVYSRVLSTRWKAEVYLKCEQLQDIGAFKIRGAVNFAMQLSKKELDRGIITHSSGNHAQAIARVAHMLGVEANVVMPIYSNAKKVENAKKWGATMHFCEPTFEARQKSAEELVDFTGGALIPPFDHEWIISGQATAAMECIQSEPNIDLLLAPLGGGGLLSGTCLAREHFSANTDVVGCEPANAADGHEGLKKGGRITAYAPNTIADGLRTVVGEIPFSIIQNAVDDIWLAEENEIAEWLYMFWSEEKMIVEPSSVVPIAAADHQRDQLKDKKIVIIITGGNVDFTNLP
ncbi:MAG: pyridoxal-phosphate dependent enzyme [Salibacteraceae bacterium]